MELHQAVSVGNVVSLVSLLRARADLEAKIGIHPGDPLWREQLHCGIRYPAGELSGVDDVLPLHLAAICGHDKTVKLLIQAKADVKAADRDILSTSWSLPSPVADICEP